MKKREDFRNILKKGEKINGFTVAAVEEINEVDGFGYVLRHDETGARVAWIATNDTNRAFAIAFKTPPANDTGVFHIIEHSVLCGSTKYPVKEPFVNLLKSSMQTFLNALTFSDKTMYPVASTNIADLENLMDVYLDAVFHPQMYRKSSIFSQEGWHYELENTEAPLTLNGVVYNEMKGALSDPEDFLYVNIKRALFPDTAYQFESGGNPDAIPTLTREEFLDTHNRHYQLHNSYSIFYGNLDIKRELAFLEKRFAKATAMNLEKERTREQGTPNKLQKQAAITPGPLLVPMATSPENRCVGLGYVVGDAAEREKILATTILLQALFGSNEAPLKRAILEANLGTDVSAELIDDQGQPFVLVQLQGAKPGVAQQFKELLESEAERLAEDGLESARLEAALAQSEFAFREQDFGHYPAGVALAISMMGTWLYDDDNVFGNLHFQDALKDLEESIGLGVFENLLLSLIPHNLHKACVEIDPVDKPAGAEEAAHLAQRKEELDKASLEKIMKKAKALHKEQETPDKAEDIEKLPVLRVSDIGEAPETPNGIAIKNAPLPCTFYPLDTHRISYTATYLDLRRFTCEELPYLGILAILLGKLDTKHHTAAELDTLVNTNLGDLAFEIAAFANHEDPLEDFSPRLIIAASSLAEKTHYLATIPYEICQETLFEDTEKICDILEQQKLSAEQTLVEAGHAAARSRARSNFSAPEKFIQQVDGIDFYHFLCDLVKNWDTRAKATCEILRNIQGRLFKTDGASVSFAGEKKDLDVFWKTGGNLGFIDDGFPTKSQLQIKVGSAQDEGFIVPANVCFCSLAAPGALLNDPLHFSGAWLVASRAISYDYLWNEVRVLGGAYGAGFGATADSLMSFYSYRDPAIDPTLKRFKDTGTWLSRFAPTKRDEEGYVVATVAALDNPKKPRQIMLTKDHLRMCHFPADWERTIRDEALRTTTKEIQALAPTLKDASDNNSICVIGGSEFFEKSSANLNVKNLLGH